jgi:PAS domain S-box-containing protein
VADERIEPTPPRQTWLDPARDVLDIITRSSADGITIQDATGGLIYANDAAARMCGFPSGQDMQRASPEEIRDRFEILDEDGNPLPVEELPGRRALQGDREPQAVVRFRKKRSDVEDRWALIRATPLFDRLGHPQNVVNVIVDVTEDRSKQRAYAFLADATRELTRSLDWEATIRRVARLAVPDMADWCSVDIVEPDGSLSLVALAHVDPVKVEWAYELRRRHPPLATDPTGVVNVARTGVSELIPEITPEMIEAANITDPELLEIVERLQLRSVMYIPLIARGRIIGVLSMVRAESGRRYTQEDVRLAEDLASRAALAIDNARLYRERDQIARSLQERLLPRVLPEVPGLDVAARYVPAGDALQAGGDFYDLFEMDDGSWKALIGDVRGKGAEAAALMGFVRFTIRAASRQDTRPSEALVKLNRALLEELEAGDGGEFCTAAIVRFRLEEGRARVTVAVAGHPLPIIIRADGTLEEAGTPGTLLGVFEELDVSDTLVELRAGDTIVMLTDGVFEAGREEGWQEDAIPRLLATCAGLPADVTADRILAAVSGVEDRRTDDVAVLVIQLRT